MSIRQSSMHGQWSSRWAFILAATGSAVGLGNIWRFPYLAGENGGAIFVLLYIFCVIMVGLPIMIAEILLGRRGRHSPINTMSILAREEGVSNHWHFLGWIGVVAGLIILSYYSVIAGWTISYIFKTGSGVFIDADGAFSQQVFLDLVSDPWVLLIWHTIFMFLTIVVVARGVKNGLEKTVKLLMPTLFILLLVMVVYSANTEKFTEGLSYLFVPDLSRLSDKNFFADLLLPALGQAFFSLSLGMGAIMIYGSYLSKKSSILTTSLSVAFADTLVSLLSGIIIFPIVFTYGLEPAGGPGLIFVSLPIAFGQMPFGTLFGGLFFILLMFAAWASSISLLEPAVSYMVENRNISRIWSSICIGLLAWLLGILTILSFNKLEFQFSFFGQLKKNGLFDMFDILTSNIMLPMGGLLIAIFAGWKMSRYSTAEELGLGDGILYKMWLITIRYIAPLGVIIIFLNAIGFFNLLGLTEEIIL